MKLEVQQNAAKVFYHLSAMRLSERRRDAEGFVRFLLRMRKLRGVFEAEARRLLCLLFLRLGQMPAENVGTRMLLK